MKKSYEKGYVSGLHMAIRVTGTTNYKNVMSLLERIKGSIRKKTLFSMLLYMLRSWKNVEVHLQDSLSVLSELKFCVLLFAVCKACARVHRQSSLPFFGYLVECSLI